MILGRGRAIAAGPPLEVGKIAEGKVFEVLVKADYLPHPEGWDFVRVDRTDDGYWVRGVGEPPSPAMSVPARLEDAYVLLTAGHQHLP